MDNPMIAYTELLPLRVHPILVLLIIPLALAWGIPVNSSWKFITFNIIACYFELITVPKDHPYSFTFAFHNFFLLTSKASHFRVVQQHSTYVKDAWDIEIKIWRYFGSRSDMKLQQHLSRRLKDQQIALRRAKYALRGAIAPALTAQAEIEEQEKFARLNQRCDRALVLSRMLPQSAPVPEEEDTASAATRRIDLDKRCGKEILRWLVTEIQESDGFVKPVKWTKNKWTGAITCHNGYTDKNIPVDYFANGEDLFIGSVSVLSPIQIEPALRLIETALDFIRFYDVNNFPGYDTRRLPPSHVQFKRAVAVNCEFRRYPAEFIRGEVETLDIDNPNRSDTRFVQGKLKENYVEKDRELVSILTVSVDRYLVVIFHIAYMLKHPTDRTCRELQRLFQDLILNKRKIKIWHNLPDSIAALDATMEHIFRGHRPTGQDEREHERYVASLRKPFKEAGPEDILRYPHYKDTGPDDSLHVNRPSDTEFRRGDISSNPCPLEFHGPGMDYAERNCPCDKGIIDITSIADFILRQHRFVGFGDVRWRSVTTWAESQVDYNIRDLVRWLLAGSKYQPLLCRFKNTSHIEPQKPNTEGLLPDTVEQFNNIYSMRYDIYNTQKDNFYTTDGETKDIEKDDTCLSYIVGDVVGLGLILRNLLTCETPALLAERLSHYAYKDPLEVEPVAYETALFRKPYPPISLPPLEQPNSFTIGLEADDPFLAKDRSSATIWEKLAANPAWFLKQGTHSKIDSGLTFSDVIGTAFLHTGWEYPRMVPHRPQARPSQRLRPGMTTARTVRAAAAAAASKALAEETTSKTGLAKAAAEAVEEAIAANIAGVIVTKAMEVIEVVAQAIDRRPINEAEATSRATKIHGTKIAAEKSLREAYEARKAVVGLSTTAERIANLPVSGETGAVSEVVAISGVGEGVVNSAEIARKAASAAKEQVTKLRTLIGNVDEDELGISMVLFRTADARLRSAMTRLETVRVAAEAAARVDASSRAARATGAAMVTELAARQAAAIAASTKVADTARVYQESVNQEIEAMAAAAEVSAAVKRVVGAIRAVAQAKDVCAAAAPAELQAAQRQVVETIGEEEEARAGLPAGLVVAADTTVTNIMAPSETRFEEAEARVATARTELAVARTEAAPISARVMAAQARVRKARAGVEAARVRVIAARTTQEGAGAGAGTGAGAGAVAEARAGFSRATAELEAAGADLNAQVTAVSEAKRASVELLVQAEDEAKTAAKEFERVALITARTDYEPTEQNEVESSTQERSKILSRAVGIALAASTAAVGKAETFVSAAAVAAARAGDTEIASLTASRARAAEVALTTRLTSIRLEEPIPDGNYGLDITVRNLATKILRNNCRYMPQEFRKILIPAINLNNGVWFAALVSLFEWHCELESLLLPEQELVIIYNNMNPTPEETSFRTEFAAQLGAGELLPVGPAFPILPGPINPAAIRASGKVELHNFADEICAEILIFMLVKEISAFEELDAAQRLVLGLDKMVTEYCVSVGFSLWDSVTLKHVKDTFQLDSFIYQDPHWFKRLQVLLGHEFVEGTPMSSPSSHIFSECGIKNRTKLVEMLIQEVERFLRISKYQEELADHLKKTVLIAYKQEKRNLISNIKARANRMANELKYTPDRREPLYKLNKLYKPDLARPWIVEPRVITEADALRAARQNLADWRLPEWCTLLLKGGVSDYSGAATERLFTTPHTTYPKPSAVRIRAPWLEAIIALLTLNPQTGLDKWDGIRKWWTSGLWIQGLGLADEYVDQALLPDLRLVTDDDPVPNPVSTTELQDRRTHNAVSRGWVHQALAADREIEAIAFESSTQ